jgi:uncharacterized protein YigE (DUF2233 family)
MLLVAVLLGLAAASPSPEASAWTPLEAGLELRWVSAREPSASGDSRIAVVRADPTTWRLEVVGQGLGGETSSRSAREWARGRDLALAVNAGMFGEDYTTHVGYLETGGTVLSRRINSYQSVAAFDPRDPARVPPFRIFDLDVAGVTLESLRADYGSLVQNLRLVKRPGVNRWSPQEKRWSEAALGEDGEGRILFMFSASPFSMHDLVRELLAADIGLVAAQHLEGGRLAQLYLRAGGVELELFEGSANATAGDGGSASAWPIPNALGLRRRSGAK